MDSRSEIREFLTSRRARITPEQAGLPTYGARRVPGLRREEVAVVAGVSVPYYTRLERGDTRSHAAAFVRNGRLDILAANPLGRALYSDMFAGAAPPANSARFIFLDLRSRDFYADWGKAADDTVAVLRAEAGRDPYDRDLSDLVGELSTRTDDVRTRWARHGVRQHVTGIKHFHHPVVGDLSLTYDRLELVADPGLTMFAYTAEPGSKSAEALSLLGSWAATHEPAPPPPAAASQLSGR